MGKMSKWLRSWLTGRKEKEKSRVPMPSLPAEESRLNPLSATKERRRWSFKGHAGATKDLVSPELGVSAPSHVLLDSEIDRKKHAMAVAVATAAAADAAVAAAQAAAAVVRLTATPSSRTEATKETAAIKIQAVFRSYLARKALGALKGLVKLQALVRGHLVRKQANATLRCMHALINAQERARTQRIRMVEESQYRSQQQLSYRRSLHHPRLRRSFENDRNEDENVKIVEMDLGVSRSNSKCRNSYSMTTPEYKTNLLLQFSPAPSALTEVSPRVLSGHFEEFSFTTAQSSPHLSAMSMPTAMHNSFDYPLYPNYMANTESSRAKVRSQSAPRQRLDAYERQSSKRRLSVEGRNIPKGIRMQRSSSHVGLTANSYQYPWSIKLDKSNMSVKESECDSTSTILTNTNYCRSLLGYEINGNKY